MKKVWFLIIISSGLCLICLNPSLQEAEIQTKTSGAGQSLDAWYLERTFPNLQIPANKFYHAFETKQQSATDRNNLPEWSAIGPKNIAGRTLCLAFHPRNKDIIFLGSASGGLWKTTTAGLGTTAWERVPTGFPLLGVGAIVINPENPDEIFIGTGEMYNNDDTGPGIINRLTRGTYGIGILKSTDGGETWEKSLDWSYENFTGIQDMAYHPQNPNIIFAATSKGLLRSIDSGDNWETIHDLPMAVDIAINWENPEIIYVSHGSLFHEGFSGIYRSIDGGLSFQKLRQGFPLFYTGKTMITLDPKNPNIILASVADAFESKGLYLSMDGGDTWRRRNLEDIAKWQGWYSHDVAVNPYNSKELIYVGIDAWQSTNEGRNFLATGTYKGNPKGKIPVEEPDGPPGYVHSDIHRVYYHPFVENLVYLATDGGVFASETGGTTWESRNGGLQTTQFYANFSNSTTDSSFAMGGMQDNNSAIYDGTDAWIRVLGGDGMSAAINPLNDQIVFGSSQYGWLERSLDKGQQFDFIKRSNPEGTFSTPLEMAPSAPNIIYLASNIIERTNDFGENWELRNKNNINWGNAVLTLTVSPTNPDLIIFGTAPTKNQDIGIFISENGGVTFQKLKGLPRRIPKDFAFHPNNNEVIYAVFSGYGAAHVYKTEDGGDTWVTKDNGLPDLPHHTLLIDPEFPDHLYIGNDLGVYFSENGGENWKPMMKGLPEVIYAMHLSYSPTNRKIRLASHGNGVYEASMVYQLPPTPMVNEDGYLITIAPNPTTDFGNINLTLSEPTEVNLELFDAKGALIQNIIQGEIRNGRNLLRTDLSFLPSGVYFYRMFLKNTLTEKTSISTHRIVKQ